MLCMNASKVLDVWVIGIQQEKLYLKMYLLHNCLVCTITKDFFSVIYLGRFQCGHPLVEQQISRQYSFSVCSADEATFCVHNGVVNKHVSRSGKTKIYVSHMDW
jgi:hypothetical protein